MFFRLSHTDGACTRNIVKKVTTVETIVKNFVNPTQPTYLLLLDTAQLCQLAGDLQCVAKQNQFKTLNLVTAGSYKGAVNPGILKSSQLGAFNFKASTSAMKGTPSFLRLEYQSTTS